MDDRHIEEFEKHRAAKNARYRQMFDDISSYSMAKRAWLEQQKIPKRMFESEAKHQARIYELMLKDLESSYPEEVAQEREMRAAR